MQNIYFLNWVSKIKFSCNCLNIKRFALFAMLLVSQQLFSQIYDKPIKVGANVHQIQMLDRNPKIGYGLEFDYYLTDNLSFNSTFVVGQNYAHAPVGSIFLLLLAYGAGDFGGCSGFFSYDIGFYILLASLSEGIAYHVHITDQVKVSIFARPLGLEYQYDKELIGNSKPNLYLAGGTGIKFNFIPKPRLYISPYFEYRINYSVINQGIAFGLNAGILFNKDRKKVDLNMDEETEY